MLRLFMPRPRRTRDIVSFLLQQGMHVYVDKPLAYTLDAASRLVTLSESTRRFLMVGFNRRYAPMYRSFADQPGRRVVLFQRIGVPAPISRGG